MNGIFKFFDSSIGKKFVIAVTGLLMCLFLIGHLAGNLLLFVGQPQFNAYAQAMAKNPLLVPIELVLLAILVSHMVNAVRVTLENRRARPTGYADEVPVGDRNAASATMWITGPIVFIFLAVHLYNFKFGDIREGDLYTTVVTVFRNPGWAAFYVICMIVLGLHLFHGTRSGFQSLGLLGSGVDPAAKTLGKIFAVVIAGGFLLFPLWGYLLK